MSTRVKICGITRAEDARNAARCGADAIGLVFYRNSPRCVDLQRAKKIVQALPPFVSAVGLFVNAPRQEVLDVLGELSLGLLQFHGDEDARYCGSFATPYLKAVRVKEGLDLLKYANAYSSARGLLLDSYVEGVAGGSGKSFNWQWIPQTLPLPVVLSGGLDADNVIQAIRQVKPWAVDVSSAVESAPGIKDKAKIAALMESIRHANV